MNYTFDGNWNFKIVLEEFNQLEFENSSNVVEIVIRDFLDEEIEPLNQQINAINYVIKNQNIIVDTILESIWNKWNEIYEDYSIDDDKDFPNITEKNDLKKVIGIRTIYIKPLHKNDFAYYGLEGNCMWDEEHGLGLVSHKDRIIELGGAEEADGGGSESNDDPDNKRPKEPEIPQLYNNHPTFGNLKPSHKEANANYPHILIERNLIKEFEGYIKNQPDVDFIHPDDWQKRTYLKTACMCNTEKIFNLLLPTAQNLDKAIYNSHKRKNIDFIEKLIEKGADIHEKYFGTSILSEAVEQHLRTISANLTKEQMDANQQRMIDYYNQPGVNKFNPILKEITMHPNDWIKRSRKYIEFLMGHKIELDQQKINYVKHGSRNNPEALKAIEKEVNWINEQL